MFAWLKRLFSSVPEPKTKEERQTIYKPDNFRVVDLRIKAAERREQRQNFRSNSTKSSPNSYREENDHLPTYMIASTVLNQPSYHSSPEPYCPPTYNDSPAYDSGSSSCDSGGGISSD